MLPIGNLDQAPLRRRGVPVTARRRRWREAAQPLPPSGSFRIVAALADAPASSKAGLAAAAPASHIRAMPLTANPDWTQIALYALGGALLLILLFRLPVVGRALRFAFSLAIAAFAIFILIQQAPYQPWLARLADDLGLDPQEVTGREVRIQMASDGHFWADATLNGVRRRMLIDSGATVTAISEATAAAARVEESGAPVPVVLRTANGMAPARAASVEELRLGNIVARDLKVVVSPAFGDMEVIGMNFLSKLASWRVEGRTLILVPHHPRPERNRSNPARP